MQKEKIVSAVCFVHQHYGLCSRRCQRQRKCLLKANDSTEALTAAPVAPTEPLLLFSSEEERRRSRRLWQTMNPGLVARVVR